MRFTASQNGWGLRYEIWKIEITGYCTHDTKAARAVGSPLDQLNVQRQSSMCGVQTQGLVQRSRLERRMIPH